MGNVLQELLKNTLGPSWRTSSAGLGTLVVVVLLLLSGAADFQVPAIDVGEDGVASLRVDESGSPVMVDAPAPTLSLLLVGLSAAGIGRASRDNKVSSQDAGVRQ